LKSGVKCDKLLIAVEKNRHNVLTILRLPVNPVAWKNKTVAFPNERW